MKFRSCSGVFLGVLLLSCSLAHAQPTDEDTSSQAAAFARAGEKSMNPDTGVNFLGLYRKNSQDYNSSSVPTGFSFQEAEIQFSADVDPYFRAVALFSLSMQSSTSGSTTSNDFMIDPEEVYLETLSLPSLTFKLGQFKTAMGRHNILHTHAFPFIDAPLINQALFGDEGLNGVGVSGSVLIPAPWFSDFTIQAISGQSAILFNNPNPKKSAGIAQLKNLWDLSDDTTIELNIFGTTGANQYESNSYAYGSDVTLKWRPSVGGKYRALIWTTEYINGLIDGNNVGGSPTFGPRLGGMASWVQYQFAQRWWAQARAELTGIPRAENAPLTQKQSLLLAFNPSEFSGFRAQYDHQTGTAYPVNNALTFQWNISIGAHPAHAY